MEDFNEQNNTQKIDKAEAVNGEANTKTEDQNTGMPINQTQQDNQPQYRDIQEQTQPMNQYQTQQPSNQQTQYQQPQQGQQYQNPQYPGQQSQSQQSQGQQTVYQQPQYQQNTRQPGPQPYQYQYQYQQPQNQPITPPVSNLAIASMVLGIVSFLLDCIIFISIPTAIISLVLGIISLKEKKGGKGLAIAGIIISSIALLFIILTFIAFLIPFSDGSIFDSIKSEMNSSYY